MDPSAITDWLAAQLPTWLHPAVTFLPPWAVNLLAVVIGVCLILLFLIGAKERVLKVLEFFGLKKSDTRKLHHDIAELREIVEALARSLAHRPVEVAVLPPLDTPPNSLTYAREPPQDTFKDAPGAHPTEWGQFIRLLEKEPEILRHGVASKLIALWREHGPDSIENESMLLNVTERQVGIGRELIAQVARRQLGLN